MKQMKKRFLIMQVIPSLLLFLSTILTTVCFGQINFTSGLKSYHPMNGDYYNAAQDYNKHPQFYNSTFGVDSLGAATNAGQFNGTNRVNSNAKLVDTDINNFSIDLWFKTSNTGSQVLFWEGLINQQSVWIRIEPASSRIRALVGGTTFLDVNSTAAFNDGYWHHLALTADNTADVLRIYIDGLLNNTTLGSWPTATTTNITRLGARDDLSGQFMNGLIDELRVWNRALSAVEVAGLHNMPHISINTLPSTSFCNNSSFSLSFTVSGGAGAFQTGNNFYAELSDINGSFEFPQIVGMTAGTGSGTMTINLPDSIGTGSNYRIRIIASNYPMASDNFATITITNANAGVGYDIFSKLLLHYKLDSTATDYAGLNMHGTVSGNAVAVDDRLGNPTAAMSMGTTGRIAVGKPYPIYRKFHNTNNPFTLSFWLRQSSTPGTFGYIFSAWDPGSNNGLWIGTTSAGRVRFRVNVNQAVEAGNTNNQWQQFTCVYTGSAIRIYRDGVLIASTNTTGTIQIISDLELGRNTVSAGSVGVQQLSGRLDDFKIFDRAFTAQEVSVLYNGLAYNNGPLCDGDDVELYAPTHANLTYAWSGPSSFSSTIQNPTYPTFNSITNSGEYLLTLTLDGCVGTPSSTMLNSTVAPVASVTGQTICVGQTATISATGATSVNHYQWFTDALGVNLIADSTASIPVSPTQTDTFYVNIKENPLCQSPLRPVIVTVNAVPTVAANASNTTICAGQSVTLTGSGAQNYTWNNGVNNGVAFAPSTTTTYQVTGTDANGCNNTAQITITVNPIVTATANASSTTICAGQSVTLTGGGAQNYLWNNGATNGVPITPSITTTYQVTGTDVNGCSNTAQITINVNSNPAVTANATSTNVCNSASVTLTGGGAQSYIWDNGVTNGAAFTPSATATYQVTGTDSNGCNNTAQITVSVNVLPSVTANATNTTICAGTAVNLTGGGAQNYVWNNGVTNGVAFIPSTTTTYQVTGTDSNGCTNTAQITVNVNTTPTVTANATNTSICAGTSVTLTGGGAQNYTWNNGATNGVAITPSVTTTYQVTGTAANGCNNTAQVTVNVNNNPTVTANATSTNLCNSASVTLTGGGAQNYIWDNGVSNGVAFTPSTTATYQVTGTDSNGCTNTAQITINVYTAPPVTANASNTTICAGESVTLTGGGAQNYTWNNGAANGVAIMPSTTTTYQVTGTDSNGCNNTAQITINVNSNPAVTANASNTTICVGESISLTGGGAQNYVWNNSITNGTAFTPSVSATYQVTGTDSNGCNNTATILITVNPLPTTSAINGDILVNCASASELYNVLNTNGSTYSWTVPAGANILNGQGSNAIEIDFNSNFGIVEVQETDLNGCVGTSVQLTIGCATGLELTSKDDINVYPIPAQNYLNIELNDFAPSALLNLYDMQGKLISSQWIDNQSRIDISDFPEAAYIGRVIGEDGERSFRFLKRD